MVFRHPIFFLVFLAGLLSASAFLPPRKVSARPLAATIEGSAPLDSPQCFATAISLAVNVADAIDEAVEKCLTQFVGNSQVDLALFHVSSSHLNAASASEISARLRQKLPGLKVYLGATCGGTLASFGADQEPLEVEAQLAFSLVLCALPGVEIRPFWLDEQSLPGGTKALDVEAWQNVFGLPVAPTDDAQPIFLTYPLPGFSNYLGDMLTGLDAAYPRAQKAGGIASTVSSLHKPRAWVGYGDETSMDSIVAGTREPANSLDDEEKSEPPSEVPGALPNTQGSGDPEKDALAAVGGLAGLAEEYPDEPLDVAKLLDLSDSTSRSNVEAVDDEGETAEDMYSLFAPSERVLPKEGVDAFYDGCCGVILIGDIRAQCMVAAGARPVSPVYYCAQSDGNSLKLIRMAKGEDGIGGLDPLAPAVPPLKEMTRLQNDEKLLNPDDAKLMQRSLLVGLEQLPRAAPTAAAAERILRQRRAQAREAKNKENKEKGKLPRRAPSEDLKDLPADDSTGPTYSVQRVLRTSMKDGSFLLPEAASEGQRMRFFVRDRTAAEKNLEMVLSGYKRRALAASLIPPTGAPGAVPFNPGLALMISGMDRGRTMFGEVGYESRQLATYVKAPMNGFFSNGPIASTATTEESRGPTTVHGSSSVFLLLGPRSSRPLGTYFPKKTEDPEETSSPKNPPPQSWAEWEGPQARRRVTDTGRSMNVGSVEWSVAEKTAQPRNRLEAVVWAKEAEIDRLRDRYPLPMLLAKVKGASADPELAPRGFLDALREAIDAETGMLVIAELKKSHPFKGVIRADYDVKSIAKSFQSAGAAALSVCVDNRFFGGSLDDLTCARAETSLPVIGSDFVLYPYQIYQARSVGADALRLTSAALPSTDLIYFHKIISSQGMDPVVVCSSLVEAEEVMEALHGSNQTVKAMILSGRDYTDFSAAPERVAGMLQSERGEKLKAQLKDQGALLLSEGSIRTKEQLDMLHDAGVQAVIVGEALLRAPDAQVTFSELVG